MATVPQKRNQTLPPEFADTLRTLHRDQDPRLAPTLSVARRNGWTLQALAEPIGITRERVRQIVTFECSWAGVDINDLPDVPPRPLKRLPSPKPPRKRLTVRPEVAERLRELQAVAARVNGGTPADSPDREVSKQFTAELDALIKQGVSVKHLAGVLETQRSAITLRLGRHGYRALPPSQADTAYRGHAVYETAEGHRVQDACHRGHPLSGNNLYISPKGARACKACNRINARAYQDRKRATTTTASDQQAMRPDVEPSTNTA
jgi:hypothetical protein